MNDFQQQYKKKGIGFGNTGDARILRAIKVQDARRLTRAQKFAQNRDLQKDEENSNSQKESRLVKLLKWQKEREKLKKLNEVKKKPVFKVGIVHHKLYSPIQDSKSIPQTEHHPEAVKPSSSAPTQRITRATEKRLARKLAVQPNQIQPKGKVIQRKKKMMSFAPENYTFKGPVGLTNVPLFGRAALNKEKGEPIKISPWRIHIHGSSSDKISQKSTMDSEVLFGQAALNDNKSIGKFPEPSNEVLANEMLSMADMNTKLSIMKTPYKSGSDLRYTSSTSSIESITLRLSPEQLETLDCPEKRTSPCKRNTPTNDVINNIKDNHAMSPAFFSPYIVSSRGKNNARKEQQIRRGMGNSPSEIPTKETVMQNLNISIEEEERTAQYFKFILDREATRLTELCQKWSDIKINVPEDASYQIMQAIGQTNLLMNKKFQRFLNLVQDCETGKGEMLVTCKDLQGFWDMMYMEVKDCESRFAKLEELRAKGWVEDEPEPVRKVVRKKGPVKRKVTAPISKQSSIREMIAAARKQKVAAQEDSDIIIVDKKRLDPTFPKLSPLKANDNREINVLKPALKKMVEHNVSTPSTDFKRMSMLQKVQLSTEKKYKSPLTIMKVSQMCKTPDVQLDHSITYVNSDQTPGRSILKRSAVLKDELSRDKSTYKVNFNDTIICNEIPVDEEAQRKLDLAARLSMIDSLDFDNFHKPVADSPNTSIVLSSQGANFGCENYYEVRAEKKLDFTDDSFEEIDQPKTNRNIEVQDTKVNNDIEDDCIADIPKMVELTSKTNSKLKNKVLKRQDAIDLPDDFINEKPEVLRTLRNRTIKAGDTPTRKHISRKQVILSQHTEAHDKLEDSGQKENTSPTKSRRKSSMKNTRTQKLNSQDDETEETIDGRAKSILLKTNENLDVCEKTRRSTRKSIRFTGEECMVCADSKPTLPKTPNVRRQTPRRSRKISLLPMGSEDQVSTSNTESADLISWDSPVTRSSAKQKK
ncbi:disks large-associated protein 5 [Cephus cinctus]|uniref:Disks large-associated protein 5 n=1 Tax=Cephus cinctus TaxID=211228 RepID=A0AAJ7CAG0_CEPCN|nr:disks large-associated protein 5 [Cephus cinctus]